ncbi:MAG: hypothetical protein NC300_05230 [Bacteroidales bacterium]|nr:hypothetical protein [Clostridium sp.]MCM1203526.1 hypothetical protein [Bacteroidales bacterium]
MNRKGSGWSAGQTRIAGLLTGALIILCLAGCGKGESRKPELKTPAAESLQGLPVEKKDIEKHLILKGVLIGESTNYYYKEQKSNLEYKVRLGEKVKKGQVLAVAGGDELEDRLKRLNQEMEEAKAALDYQQNYGGINQEILTLKYQYAAETDREHAANAVKKAEVDQGYQVQLLSLQIANLNQEISEVKNQIEQNTLYAQKDGCVSFISYMTEVSAFYNVLVVTDESSLYVSLEDTLPQAQAEAYLRAYTLKDGKQLPLHEYSYTEAEKQRAKQNTMILNPRFRFAENTLDIGDRLPVYLVLEEQKNVLTVPKSCIYQGEDGQYVYLIHGESKEKCFVETGIENDVEIQIVSGVEEGDMVYYPVDMTVEYEGTQIVEKDTVSLSAVEEQCSLYYPAHCNIVTGVGQCKISYATDKTYLEKGDVIARVNPLAGKADLQEKENQINTLDSQYTTQKAMHEETVRLLNEEINTLQNKEVKSSAGSGEEKTVPAEETSETEISGEKKEAGANGGGESGDDSEEEISDKEPQYPLSVQLKLKNLELSMELLSQKYDEENYTRQCRRLEQELAEWKKKTGEVVITAPEEGEFINYMDWMQEAQMLDENAPIGTIQKASVAYVRVENKDNGLRYGNRVTLKDLEGNTYQGTVVGAYPSGEIKEEVQTGGGGTMTVTSDADENQQSAYIELSGEDIFEKGNVSYQANQVKDVIAVDRTLVKSENRNHFIWILREGKPCRQYVEFMAVAENKLWILNGLEEGDILLTGVK